MIQYFKDSFMYILSVIELIVSISLTVTGEKTLSIIVGIAFIASIVYAITMSVIKNKKKKKANKKGPTVIDGKPLDLLMLADAFRTQMDSVELSKVIHKAIIKENNDLTVVWNYAGKCIKKEGESFFVFSIQGGNDTPLEKLNCYGFDLINDPERKQPIYATLLPTEQGISSDYKVKKIVVPFLKKSNKTVFFQLNSTIHGLIAWYIMRIIIFLLFLLKMTSSMSIKLFLNSRQLLQSGLERMIVMEIC